MAMYRYRQRNGPWIGSDPPSSVTKDVFLLLQIFLHPNIQLDFLPIMSHIQLLEFCKQDFSLDMEISFKKVFWRMGMLALCLSSVLLQEKGPIALNQATRGMR